MQMAKEGVKEELEEKDNPRKRKGAHVETPVRRPYTLRIRVKNTAKYISSLTSDIQPLNQADSGRPRSSDLIPNFVEPRVVWLDVRCELSEVNLVGARILDCVEFGLSPHREILHAEQKHAMKGTKTLFKESMDLSAGIKELTTKEKEIKENCLGKTPQVTAGRLVMQVKIKSISMTSNSKYSEANKVPISHSNVAFHSAKRSPAANEDTNASPPNSPLYDMPPPSTHVQKRARRAKRNLQLERWQRNEEAKSRQERYQRRAERECVDTTTKHIQWKEDLVEYFDIIQEPRDVTCKVKFVGLKFPPTKVLL